MPIYEYKCEACGAIVEALQKFSDEPLTTCSDCKGPLKKLVSQSSFHLKGSGWYVTDYADKSKNTSKSSEAKETPKLADASPKPADTASGSAES